MQNQQLEDARQQNLRKIQQLRHTLEQAQQQEQQYSRQLMEVLPAKKFKRDELQKKTALNLSPLNFILNLYLSLRKNHKK